MRTAAAIRCYCICLFLSASITLFPAVSFAQYAAATHPILQGAQWQKQEDYAEQHLPGKQFGEMKKIVSSLASWLQLACTDSLTCTPAWCGAYFSNKTNAFPLFKYEMRAGFYAGDVGNLHGEPGNEGRFVITANDLSVMQQTFQLNGSPYLSIRPSASLYQGILYNEFANEKEDTGSAARFTRAWLVSYADRLPYTVISRREYLEAATKEILADKERMRDDLKQRIPVKSAAEEEAVKAREIREIENMYTGAMRDNRVRMYLASYKPDSVYFKENFTALSAPLDADSLLLDSLLKKSPVEELGRPAYVSVPAHEFKSFEDSVPGSRMLARWNLDYFDKNISLARPQFLVISWQYDPADPLAIRIDRQLREKLELCDLAALLSK